MFRPARSADHVLIRSGTRVQVNHISGGTLVVTASETAAPAAAPGKT
jgi:hypothetical protein